MVDKWERIAEYVTRFFQRNDKFDIKWNSRIFCVRISQMNEFQWDLKIISNFKHMIDYLCEHRGCTSHVLNLLLQIDQQKAEFFVCFKDKKQQNFEILFFHVSCVCMHVKGNEMRMDLFYWQKIGITNMISAVDDSIIEP